MLDQPGNNDKMTSASLSVGPYDETLFRFGMN